MAHYAYKCACYDIDYPKFQQLVKQFEEQEGREHDGDSNYDGDNWYIMEMWIRELRAENERLRASPASVPEGWKSLTDVQWMNIVNLNHAWRNVDKEDAINEVVKLVEAKCKENNLATQSAVACLQSMCEESLAPDVYEMWLQVKAALITTRKTLAALAEQNEKLRKVLVEAKSMVGHPDNIAVIDTALSLPNLATPVLNRIKGNK